MTFISGNRLFFALDYCVMQNSFNKYNICYTYCVCVCVFVCYFPNFLVSTFTINKYSNKIQIKFKQNSNSPRI